MEPGYNCNPGRSYNGKQVTGSDRHGHEGRRKDITQQVKSQDKGIFTVSTIQATRCRWGPAGLQPGIKAGDEMNKDEMRQI